MYSLLFMDFSLQLKLLLKGEYYYFFGIFLLRLQQKVNKEIDRNQTIF